MRREAHHNRANSGKRSITEPPKQRRTVEDILPSIYNSADGESNSVEQPNGTNNNNHSFYENQHQNSTTELESYNYSNFQNNLPNSSNINNSAISNPANQMDLFNYPQIQNLGGFTKEQDRFLNITENIRNNTPKFLLNLYRVLSYNSCRSVSWNNEGTSIWIHNKTEFMQEVAPLLTRSTNYTGFTRQLSNYGFTKVKQFANASQMDEYYSEYFCRDRPELLLNCVKSNIDKSKVSEKFKSNSQSINLFSNLQEAESRKKDGISAMQNHEMCIKLQKKALNEILNKMHKLEVENFGLRKEILKMNEKINRQDGVIKNIGHFLSKICLSQEADMKMDDADLMQLQCLNNNSPSLPLTYNNSNDSIDRKYNNSKNTKDENSELDSHSETINF